MGTLAKGDIKNLTLKERLQMKKSTKALILDLSGSMSTEVEPNKSRYETLVDIVQGVVGTPTMIGFNSEAFLIEAKDKIPHPIGFTALAKAINLAKSMGINAAVLITDGEVTDRAESLEAIKGFHLEALYVGNGERPAFLNELANKSGGFCSKEDLKNVKEIGEKMQLLLGDGTVKGGPIQL